jgi:hypothetical protein
MRTAIRLPSKWDAGYISEDYKRLGASTRIKQQAIYQLGIILLVHAPVHATDFPIVNVHVDEL